MINKQIPHIETTAQGIADLAASYYLPLVVVRDQHQKLGAFLQGEDNIEAILRQLNLSLVGIIPAIYPELLGDQRFTQIHGCRYPYIVGEMANGIATADMVIASAKAGLMGCFGAGGLVPELVEKNIKYINSKLSDQEINWSSNLIHSPNEPTIEEAVVQLYLHYKVRRISASAYMTLSSDVVHYACKGLHINSQGIIERSNFIMAKISRPETALHFMKPAPEKMLALLVEQGKLTHQEAELARHIPLAQDITVEADSGGHTDNRALTALFPTIMQYAKKITLEHQNRFQFRIGAAGGIGTPEAATAAFSMGAAYILTGSINQAAVESGLSMIGKKMLAKADMVDVMMAPAADMFELGVKLQVLKKGTLFGMRAAKLYEVYSNYKSFQEIPQLTKNKLEQELFHDTLENIWLTTREFFLKRDVKQVALAEKNEHYKMALVFRWYLGLSSRWAITGQQDRLFDYQIWCGPAMGSFNDWVKGSFLELLENRTVVQIAKNILAGAAYLTRVYQLKSFGFEFPVGTSDFKPEKFS
ncbi:MAG: PfaD family polyunsaturated fatty acid/polyketide biosynthesis protein [Gammaproteobacteria bacterium]|nr:PfaD family polyunsaturated fatty acid/polyketide biosynthesis protein [Gammaproteobacteria bacterium]